MTGWAGDFGPFDFTAEDSIAVFGGSGSRHQLSAETRARLEALQERDRDELRTSFGKKRRTAGDGRDDRAPAEAEVEDSGGGDRLRRDSSGRFLQPVDGEGAL